MVNDYVYSNSENSHCRVIYLLFCFAYERQDIVIRPSVILGIGVTNQTATTELSQMDVNGGGWFQACLHLTNG